MTDTDVLIVGGGPGGSTLARLLRGHGLDVTVMDRSTFPRDKVCAGWITPAVVSSLGLDLVDYAGSRVLQPIHGFVVGMIGGRATATRREREPVSYGIRRCEFDTYLLERSGARMRLGEALSGMRRQGRRWIVNEELRVPLVVGAGGHFCPVARRLGARPGRSETAVMAQEIEFRLPAGRASACRVDPSVPELYFCPDLRGYGWAFRKGEWLNVGLGREDPHELGAHVAAFRDGLVRGERIPADTPSRFRGHAYLLWSSAGRRVHDDGVLLIGDAAGLAYPESGEGIRTAVESALLAASVITEAGGDYRDRRLASYAALLADRFGTRRPRRNARPPGAVKRFLARRMMPTEWFARRVVIDRWFLHRDQPALMP